MALVNPFAPEDAEKNNTSFADDGIAAGSNNDDTEDPFAGRDAPGYAASTSD